LSKRAKQSGGRDPELRDAIAKAIETPNAAPEPHVYPKSELAADLLDVYEGISADVAQQNHNTNADSELKGQMAHADLVRNALGPKLFKGMIKKLRDKHMNDWAKDRGLPPLPTKTLQRYFKIRPL
jgi:hypothetical protein